MASGVGSRYAQGWRRLCTSSANDLLFPSAGPALSTAGAPGSTSSALLPTSAVMIDSYICKHSVGALSPGTALSTIGAPGGTSSALLGDAAATPGDIFIRCFL
jgi:hypothetical protein